MAPYTKTILFLALLATATTTTTCALDAESNNWILTKLFNSPTTKQEVAPQKRHVFGRKENTTSSSEEGQTYSTYLTAALGIFLALGTWYLPIGNNNKKNIKKNITIDNYSTCTESNSDLETTIDSSSSSDEDSENNNDEHQQQKRQQLVKNKPASGYGNFLSFISEDSPPVIEPTENKIMTINQIKELMIENEISKEKCVELFKVYDDKLEMLYKNLVRLKEKKGD